MAVQESRLVISIDARNAERTAKALNSELQGITNNGAKAENQINSMGGSLKALAGYMGGILTIGSAISMADGYTQMAARIRNATSSAQEYELVQERILATANGTYRALSEAQEVYLSLAGGMKSLGKTTADTLDVADSLSYAFVANAARADQAQSAMDALSKSMAKGKIDADAWISIVSAADNVIADMAKTTGKTEAEIRKLGAEGKASLTDLLETLKATRDTNKQLADNMENSVADGFQKLTNSVTVYLGKLNETSGATGTIAAALGGLGDNIDKVAVAGGILASVMAGRVTSGYAAATVAAIANASATAASAGAMATATAAARALYIALGGPVGLAVTVAGAAASYLLLSNNTKDNTKSLRENNEAVNDAIQKYRELDDVQKRAQQAAEKSKLSELTESYKELTDDLNTNAYALSRHNDFTREQSKEVNALIAEFKRTGDLDKFSTAINRLSFVSQDSKDKFNALAGQVRTSGNEYKNQKQFVDAMTNSLNQNAAAGDNAARGIRNAAQANREYTQSLQQKLYDQVFLNTVTQKYGKSLQEAQLLLEAQKKTKGEISVEDKKLISAISQQTKAAEDYNKAQSAGAKASKKAQSEAAKEAKQQAKEAERLQEEQYQLREQIAYEYADRIGKIEKDLAREIADIQKAGFASPEQTQGFIQNAQNRADIEKQLYIAQLTQQYSEWRATEEQKLDYKVHVNELMIQLDSDMNDDLKKQAMQSLKDQANYELAQIELNKEKRLFAANEIFMSEKDKIAERYRLEREEILRNKQLTEQERQTQIAGTFGREALDTATQQQGVAQNYLGAIGVDYSMEAEFQKKKEAIIAANEWEFITEQEKNQRLLDLEKEFQQAKSDIALSSTEQIFSSLASMFDKNDEKQRKYYRAMLVLEKTAAIARSVIAIQSGIAQASSLPFPMNLGAMATVAAQTASIVGNIKSVADGFYTGGYTGNMGTREVAGVVHGQEYVLNAEATKRVGRGTLDALNNGGTLGGGEISVNIQNYGTSKAFEVQQIDANTVRIIARDEARNTVAADLQNPNSQISKAASQNLNAPRRRG